MTTEKEARLELIGQCFVTHTNANDPDRDISTTIEAAIQSLRIIQVELSEFHAHNITEEQ